jgi:hypothetical protein
MKLVCLIFLSFFLIRNASGQVDPELLRAGRATPDSLALNMDATYNRPFIQVGKLPVAIGGYAEANYQYLSEDGISEGHQFQMRRVSLFISSSVSKRIKFLTEIEFEEGGKEINLEFASVDFEISSLLNLRGGIVLNPIGSFNQNHDGPKWDFVDRPLSSTQMLPATWSNAGFGIYGKKSKKKWAYAYEAYLTNGFDDRIINNTENKTFLPASKENPERFEESFNGSMLFTGKIAVKNSSLGEVGISYMGGVYNKFREDGLDLDKKRRVNVYAVDLNTTLPIHTYINAEWAWVDVDIPDTYTEQYGNSQQGGFVDLIQPIFRRPVLGFAESRVLAGVRLEYVDWNRGKFKSTGQ